jgi:hypothetical protein
MNVAMSVVAFLALEPAAAPANAGAAANSAAVPSSENESTFLGP